MYKSYDIDEKKITIELDTGGEVKISPDYFLHYGEDFDLEIPHTSDDLKDLIYMINGKY